MTSYIDALRQELVTATERLAGAGSTPRVARNGRWRRSPRVLAAALAGLAVSATALAATTPWQPIFGDPADPKAPQPSITADAPPAEQVAMLGVLRREQTQDDRGPTTTQALRYFGPSTEGVHTAYIRHLPAGEGGLSAILLPARSWHLSRLEKSDVACLFVGEASGSGGAKACYTTSEIAGGLAGGSLGAVEFGLVPDGVVRVVLRYADATQAVEVHDNFYEHRAPAADENAGGVTPRRVASMTWVDAQGNPTRQQPPSR
jgi:hypothetical protein